MSRDLKQILTSSDILSGEEADKLRQYCYVDECLDPNKNLGDTYGTLLKDGILPALQDCFDVRVEHFDGRKYEARQELFKTTWGLLRSPIYVVLLALTISNPDLRYTYIKIARWLASTAKIPVDGTDVSGTTALMHSISTRHYFDLDFAQIMIEAGADINRQNRFGSVAAHDITTVQLIFVTKPTLDFAKIKEMACLALQWFLEHGGNVDIKDANGLSVRAIVEDLDLLGGFEGDIFSVKGVVDKFEQQSTGRSPKNRVFPQPTARNNSCPCGSDRKYKKCCGKE